MYEWITEGGGISIFDFLKFSIFVYVYFVLLTLLCQYYVNFLRSNKW